MGTRLVGSNFIEVKSSTAMAKHGSRISILKHLGFNNEPNTDKYVVAAMGRLATVETMWRKRSRTSSIPQARGETIAVRTANPGLTRQSFRKAAKSFMTHLNVRISEIHLLFDFVGVNCKHCNIIETGITRYDSIKHPFCKPAKREITPRGVAANKELVSHTKRDMTKKLKLSKLGTFMVTLKVKLDLASDRVLSSKSIK